MEMKEGENFNLTKNGGLSQINIFSLSAVEN